MSLFTLRNPRKCNLQQQRWFSARASFAKISQMITKIVHKWQIQQRPQDQSHRGLTHKLSEKPLLAEKVLIKVHIGLGSPGIHIWASQNKILLHIERTGTLGFCVCLLFWNRILGSVLGGLTFVVPSEFSINCYGIKGY